SWSPSSSWGCSFRAGRPWSRPTGTVDTRRSSSRWSTSRPRSSSSSRPRSAGIHERSVLDLEQGLDLTLARKQADQEMGAGLVAEDGAEGWAAEAAVNQ